MQRTPKSDPVAEIFYSLMNTCIQAINDANNQLGGLDLHEGDHLRYVLNVVIGGGVYSDQGKYPSIEPETQVMGYRNELLKIVLPVAKDIQGSSVEKPHPSGNRDLDLFQTTTYEGGRIRRYSTKDKMYKDV